jgi:hypothetical protein
MKRWVFLASILVLFYFLLQRDKGQHDLSEFEQQIDKEILSDPELYLVFEKLTTLRSPAEQRSKKNIEFNKDSDENDPLETDDVLVQNALDDFRWEIKELYSLEQLLTLRDRMEDDIAQQKVLAIENLEDHFTQLNFKISIIQKEIDEREHVLS